MKNDIFNKAFLLIILLLATASTQSQISPSYNEFVVEISGVDAGQFKGVDELQAIIDWLGSLEAQG